METLEYLWLGSVPYRDAWALQRRLAAARALGAIDDLVLLLEHPPVYTMGRNGLASHVPTGAEHLVSLGAEYFEVDRGGSVTFHGPGQLVAYPILRVADVFPLADDPSRGDVVAHLRALEQALLATVGAYGVVAGRRPPYTGIWVGESKLAAIGVKLASGVTTHGAALNVTTDLNWFAEVIPCGIAGAGVCSLSSLGVKPAPRLPDVAIRFATELARTIDRRPKRAGEAVQAVIAEASLFPSEAATEVLTQA
jgi:lipoyl(octanoyl) transferase